MTNASLRELYFDELSDLYDAEEQGIRALPRMAEAVRAPELREALVKHVEESRLHLERLELIFTHWGEPRQSKSCAGLAGIVQEADDRLQRLAKGEARDAAIIGAVQRIEHYEMASYGSARSYASRLNRLDDVRLLQESLDEEVRVERRLSEMGETQIVDTERLGAA
jgi:ferritin-like metal-binding protein YciE